MTAGEIRRKYLEFFEKRGHSLIPSAPLVPENDPTTLFTGSGMQPLVPYLLGKNHPVGSRLVDSQKCFRSMDIEEVGDNRHTTFFEMLGNWSLGDYFKQDQLRWIFTFLTDKEEGVGLNPEKLFVTTFIGDEKNNIPRDVESAELWTTLFKEKGIDVKVVAIGSEENGCRVGMQGGRIFYYDAKKNWWSRSGVPENMPAGEPGGPDSEIFYRFEDSEHSKEEKNIYGEHCHPNCDCGRFLEIGNSVFMQYIKNEDGTFALLPKQNVDFGGGLERILMAKNEDADIVKVAHAEIIRALEYVSGKKYGENLEELKSFRIIADHLKASVFLIADGVLPGKTDKGYFVRRLIRRSVQHLDKLGISESAFNLAGVVGSVVAMYKEQYPELISKGSEIEQVIGAEETQFRLTLARGIKEFSRLVKQNQISAHDVFQLVTTYGFPLELVIEEAKDRGIKEVDLEGYNQLLKEHQDLSRSGSEQKFKGGLADSSEKTTQLHTAHHLLLRALQIVLGPEVHQRGSNITQERLRIDFNYGSKMTEEQKKEVERIVNEKISEQIPVVRTEMALEEAEKLGAEHEFNAKYPERVSVYSVGPIDTPFSIEFCGGPHVTNTKALGHFKIQKEEAVASGIRRIKAVLDKI